MPADARHEANRHEHGEDGERRRRDGQTDFVGSFPRSRVVILPHLHVPNDVLADDDRVVDQDTDRQRQPEQRHRLQLESHDPHGDERRQHRDRQRQSRDHRRAPRIQEEEDDEHGKDRTLDEGFLNVTNRVIDPRARILDDLDRRPRR